jgi:putative acyl-CoA dehydrogenase
MAIVLQASLLLRHSDPAVAEVFCASRLADGGHQFGTLKPSPALPGIIERHRPALSG